MSEHVDDGIGAQDERERAALRATLGRVIAAFEEERRRIAAELHSEPVQVMTAVGMRLQILRESLTEPEQLRRVEELQQAVQDAIAVLRDVIVELHPPALDFAGLAAALRDYATHAARGEAFGWELNDLLAGQPPRAIRMSLYRVAQEALSNVGRHARASHVTISLSERDGGFELRVADDGVGLAAAAVAESGRGGLAVLRDRVELAGGRLELESSPGNGTVVGCWLPAAGGEP